MNKERPTELNKKLKRLRESRDNLKLNNREKNLINQKLRDRNVEITESRDQWKMRSKELIQQKKDLEQQVLIAQREIEQERMKADLERERANKLQAEIEEVLKKKSRI
jgi:hypothetical protein